MKLGIVGHGQEKFTRETEARAKDAIERKLDIYQPESIASGESPMGGVDRWAREAAAARGIHFQPFPAEINEWNPRKGIGFKARNLQIANYSDLVLCVVVKEFPPGFKGRRFDMDHCGGKGIPEHVKSGGCWTAWRCKAQEWVII